MVRIALLIDFDGTVDERNVAALLLERFALEDWRRFAPMRFKGQITGKACIEREFLCLPARREELTAFAVRNARVRAGLDQLVSFCKERGFPVCIVSGGLDFYIRPLLAKNGLDDLPTYCGIADFDSGPRLRVSYDGAIPVCDKIGACKCFHIDRYHQEGYQVALVGDGSSDFCPAEKVDHVFARRRLLEHCQTNSIPHVPFETFFDVLERLKRLTTGAWS